MRRAGELPHPFVFHPAMLRLLLRCIKNWSSTCRQRRLRGGVQTQVQKEPERILLHPVSKAQVYRLLDATVLYHMNAVYPILIITYITYPVLWL